MQEIVLICVIALIVVGPKKLPELARALGKGYGEFRRAFDEMKRNVETDLHTEEIRRSLLDLPPPPPPVRDVPPPAESLLTEAPAPQSPPLPYPEQMDGAAPAPEQPPPTPERPAAGADGRADG
jgi:sec-independent protein translocase protein TatB